MHVKIIALLVLSLAGCATMDTEPTIEVVTQKVDIPIGQPCKEELPLVPDFCFEKLADDDDIHTLAKCLLSDRNLSIGYQGLLVTKLKSCRNDK